MPWTAKQTRYMFAKHPEIARRVVHEPGFYIKDAIRKVKRRKRAREV